MAAGRTTFLFTALALLTVVLFTADLLVGSVSVAPADIWAALTGGDCDPAIRDIILRIRLLKAVTALLAGAALAASGLQMQTLFRNPLAGPYVLGISSGAGLGVALFLLGAPLLGVSAHSFVQSLGIAGAAWATAASQAISAALCILYLRRKAPELIFARADCRMDGELLKQTAHFSFVTALHQSSLYIGKLLVQGAVNTGGTDMISAYTATTRIEGFANSFGDSGSAATSVLVAQNRGAGKEERVKGSFRSSLFLMLAMGLAMSLIMCVSASTSVGFMLGTRSGAAFENARDYLKLVALFYTLCLTGNTFAGYFNGIGKVSVPFLGATSHIALRVVLSWLLVGKMGLPAVALATGLGWVLVNALWTFVKWRMEKKQKAAERDIM